MSYKFDPQSFGPVAASLLTQPRIPPLGPGTPNAAARPRLVTLTPETLLAHASLSDRTYAQACISGLWIYHDYLDESHTLSQSIDHATGSYWHGIMHRREPDFGNSGYWFRRVGDHPIFPALASAARDYVQQATGLGRAAWLATVKKWNPFDFIDLCQACYRTSGPDHDACCAVSLLEWQLLFDHSFQHAINA